MPADSRDIWQEGIVIPPLRLGDDVLELILANVRTPDIRRGDLRAQTAANQLAERRLAGAGRAARPRHRSSRPSTRSSPTPSGARARRSARSPDGTYEAERELEGDGVTDDDVTIAVAGHRRRRRAARSTSPAPPTRSRATSTARSSVTRSACYFALRALLPADVPANAGTYAPLEHRGARGLARQRRRRRPRWWRATSRPRSRSPTPCWPRSPRPSTCPRRARAR